MSKFVQISKSKYRVLVSDVLPFERPIFFSNRFFARFLKYYGVCVDDGRLVATKNNCEGLDALLRLLGGVKGDKRRCFQYYISKEGHDDGRCLTIIHPFHQVQMVDFYDKYKTLLVDFCMRSSFSIRFPYKIATYRKDKKEFSHLLSDTGVEIITKESIKHFFAYKHYHNINKFYDDYLFLRAEKRFPYMFKLDLRDCFESITPELLSRAMFDSNMDSCPGTMAESFCSMQKAFNSKHNGIVIGPEFSRIYAEIVLQKIDHLLEQGLLNGFKLSKTEDYLFYRYVDDGFFFCKKKDTVRIFLSVYKALLSSYNLNIKKEKTKLFSQRPFLESISYIKQSLENLIYNVFESRLDTFIGFKKIQNNDYDTPTSIDYKSFVKSIRSIIGSAGYNNDGTPKVSYKDIVPYILVLIQKRLYVLLKQFDDLYRQYFEAEHDGTISRRGKEIKAKYENDFLQYLVNLIEILFYLLSCDNRMSTSIKIVTIIDNLQKFVRGQYKFTDGTISQRFDRIYVSILDENISDETQNYLYNSNPNDTNMMEILTILELQKMMSTRCQISDDFLKDFLEQSNYKKRFNFFIVFELLHFIKDSSRYEWLRYDIYSWIDKKLDTLAKHKGSDTEAVLTASELFCCPWVKNEIKQKWAEKLFGQQSSSVLTFTSKQKDLFIRWTNYSLNEELQHINSTEVY